MVAADSTSKVVLFPEVNSVFMAVDNPETGSATTILVDSGLPDFHPFEDHREVAGKFSSQLLRHNPNKGTMGCTIDYIFLTGPAQRCSGLLGEIAHNFSYGTVYIAGEMDAYPEKTRRWLDLQMPTRLRPLERNAYNLDADRYFLGRDQNNEERVNGTRINVFAANFTRTPELQGLSLALTSGSVQVVVLGGFTSAGLAALKNETLRVPEGQRLFDRGLTTRIVIGTPLPEPGASSTSPFDSWPFTTETLHGEGTGFGPWVRAADLVSVNAMGLAQRPGTMGMVTLRRQPNVPDAVEASRVAARTVDIPSL
ncbi:hypothetical protein AB8O64_35560 (plasmid) [Streptomyces sp. QH1-20]|uniref:hypothetical protein n=1 Tax=Streptomyces sp. QH1-20 TaxID=3240934 RepID=UPI003514D5AD